MALNRNHLKYAHVAARAAAGLEPANMQPCQLALKGKGDAVAAWVYTAMSRATT